MRRNIPTKEPLGVIVPQATLDFVMRPRKVPHPEARSLEEYKKACQDHFLHLLIIALKDRALPERTRLAHCVARDSHSTTDFSYQAVCQGIRNPCMEVAAAFTHITESLSRPNGHPSSHQRARDMGDTSIGNIIIFSSTPACSITQCLPFPAHACHVGLQLVENVKVPIDVVREDFHPNTGTDKGIWLFDLPNCVVKYRNHETKDILDAKSSARVLHSPKAFAHRPSIVEASKTANEATKILLADILNQAATVMMYEEGQKTVQWTVFPTIGGRSTWLRTWAAQVARRRGPKRAMVALARRIAVILHRMWIDDTDFRSEIALPHAI